GTPALGESIRTFYTAKDFPVMSDSTKIKREPFKIVIPVPLIGTLAIDNLTASQGYAVQINDMHGKPQAIEDYEGNPDGSIRPGPLSRVEYRYRTLPSPRAFDESVVANSVPVLDRIVETINGIATPHLALTHRISARHVA